MKMKSPSWEGPHGGALMGVEVPPIRPPPLRLPLLLLRPLLLRLLPLLPLLLPRAGRWGGARRAEVHRARGREGCSRGRRGRSSSGGRGPGKGQGSGATGAGGAGARGERVVGKQEVAGEGGRTGGGGGRGRQSGGSWGREGSHHPEAPPGSLRDRASPFEMV